MKLKIETKEEALKAISELQEYIKGQEEKWIKIDYSVISREIFDKYGVKPFEIMERKMRKDGNVWNNINYFDAVKEAKKLGYSLPTIQQQLVLLDAYKEKYPNDASIYHNEFLGIKELSNDEDVCYEWIYCNEYLGFLRGGNWGNGGSAGVGALNLNNGSGRTGTGLGFRCAR